MEKQTSFFQSNTAKIIMVGFLTLVLLIPLQFVASLIEERSNRQREVVDETSEKWGEDIYFYGPILKIPYKQLSESIEYDGKTNLPIKKIISVVKYAYFFPEELKNNTDVTMVKPLQRGLYKSNVFYAKMNFSGNYTTPNFKINSIADDAILWDKATVLIRTTNLKSIKSQVNLKMGDSVYRFEPTQSSQGDSMSTLTTSLVNLQTLKDTKNQSFAFQINYNGSKMIHFAPIGKTTKAKMTSNWPSPKFSGNFSPNNKNKMVTTKGFEAEWEILHLNRPFPQQSFDSLPNIKSHTFGVDFITTVDQYQQNERAVKYGFLVIGLTFLIFFLIQSVSKINIHIFQYSMIGLALIMFYTLLISITEHSSFTLAYIVAGISVIILITLYSFSILKNRKFPTLIGASLTGLYTFIFVIIQMEDYALLVGSIGLFLILAAVMYFSRKIDWSTTN